MTSLTTVDMWYSHTLVVGAGCVEVGVVEDDVLNDGVVVGRAAGPLQLRTLSPTRHNSRVVRRAGTI